MRQLETSLAHFCRMCEGTAGSRLVEVQEVRPVAPKDDKGRRDLRMILVQEIPPRRDGSPGNVPSSRFALDRRKTHPREIPQRELEVARSYEVSITSDVKARKQAEKIPSVAASVLAQAVALRVHRPQLL